MMFKQIIFLVMVFVAASAVCSSVWAQEKNAVGQGETIAAVVNDDIISAYDLFGRMRFVILSSGLPDRPEIKKRLLPQVLSMLVDETLKMQEAERLEIEVTEDDIEAGFNNIAAQNNMTSDQFKQILASQNIPYITFKNQIAAQVAWSRVVQDQLRPLVQISDSQVESFRSRMEENKGKTEYLVAEIFLPVDKKEQERDVKSLADRLTGQLVKDKAPFPKLASQFSQSASAAKGGDMGWIQEGQLAGEIDEILAKMKKGELSRPIRTLDGYHIIHMREKRTITDETIPSDQDIRARLGLENLDRLQRGYFLDLKTSAFIENRVL